MKMEWIGKRQKEVLLKMCKGWYISAIADDSGEGSINLIDTNEDIRETLTGPFLDSLIKRGGFDRTSFCPCLGRDVVEWRLKPKEKAFLKLWFN